MTAPTITSERDAEALALRLEQVPWIGLDTEFVSEDTFHPELCLVQLITPEESAVIDPQKVDMRPVWHALSQAAGTVICHAAREEMNFVLRSVGRMPDRVFDVQVAAGFASNEYPAAYASVVGRFLGQQPLKGEQRTDWRRRPLSDAQIKYALEDVRYLAPLHAKLAEMLEQRDRYRWFEEEMDAWRTEILSAQDRKDWRRVSGIGSLNWRSLAVVRELWHWRQEEARRLNQPPKRLLRDDLLVEIAKRRTDKPDQILAIRGMQRNDLKRKVHELVACVQRGEANPLEPTGRSAQRDPPPQLNLLGQFLTPALTTICRRAEVAASMVGTASDVRDLIAHHFGFSGAGQETPLLLRGWRAELVGNLLDELLTGRRSIRIRNAKSDDPL
ncbi:MAG TPA: HRDC domain-containing protein, partial [Lacipirellulaceae bacterium]|nr:HRDC domain-containing protein [Lacipirellulaceae bacterium]